MESEMNENFGQPYGSQSQPGSGPPPEQKPTSQQNSLQQTFLNLKLSTWIKCVVISIILSVAAVFIAPEFSTAQSGQPQQTVQPSQQENFNSYCEYEEDMYDYSQYNDGWNRTTEFGYLQNGQLTQLWVFGKWVDYGNNEGWETEKEEWRVIKKLTSKERTLVKR